MIAPQHAVSPTATACLSAGRGRWCGRLQRRLEVDEAKAAAEVVVDATEDRGFTDPLRTGLEDPILNQRGKILEPSGDRAIPQRIEQVVLEIDVILNRRQRGDGQQIEGVVLAEMEIRADAFLVVVFKGTADQVADKSPETRSRAAIPIAPAFSIEACSVSIGNCKSGRPPDRSTSAG